MTLTTSHIIEQQISTPTLIAIACVMGMLIILIAWLENRRTRRIWPTTIITTLRLAAVMIVVWTMAGREIVKTTTTQRQAEIAFYIDHSASMTTIDRPADYPGDTPILATRHRWQLLNNPDIDIAELVNLDTADACLQQLKSTLHQVRKQFSLGREPATLLHQAIASTRKAHQHLSQTISSRQYQNILQVIEHPVLSTLTRLEQKSSKSLALLDPRLDIDLAEMEHTVAAIASHIKAAADTESNRLQAQFANSLHADSQNRFQRINQYIHHAQNTWLNDIQKQAATNFYHFDGTVRQTLPSAQPQPDTQYGENTNLDNVIQSITRHNTKSLRAAVIFTDGRPTVPTSPLPSIDPAKPLPPVYFIPIGRTDSPADAAITHITAADQAFLGDQVTVTATINARGLENQPLAVNFYLNDQHVDTRHLQINSSQYFDQATFTADARTLDPMQFKIELQTLAEEPNRHNNHATAVTRVIDRQLNILLIDNHPRWEHRFLYNTLKRDPQYQCDQILLADAFNNQPQKLPADQPAWNQYHIVILGDIQPQQLSLPQQQMLYQLVAEQGNSLIMIAGQQTQSLASINPDSPVAKLLPVDLSKQVSLTPPFLYKLTPEARNTIAARWLNETLDDTSIIKQLNTQRNSSLATSSPARPTAHTWITMTPDNQPPAAALPFLSWHTLGRGKVIYLAQPVTHQFRQRRGDTLYLHFWANLLRWAASRKSTADPPSLDHENPLPTSKELADTRCDLPNLHQLANHTAGQIIPPTALPALIETLDLSPTVEKTPPRQSPRQLVWQRWHWIILFACLLITEWTIRKYYSMA